MESGGLLCRGCGSSNVTFNAKARLLVCNQCGREEYYNRATLNANGKVVHSRKNAISFFLDGKYADARHYAREVLDISMDNVPAMYIIAYCNEFEDKRSGRLREFFEQVKEVALEYDEVQDMILLFKASAIRLIPYEKDIIELLATNMQSEEDKKELCEVLDALCPYFISRRTSMDFLTEEMTEIYKELVEHCGIPKTCFALLKSIETNPDSPYTTNSFFLAAKCKYYFDHYVVPIGEIIACMRMSEYAEKFKSVYHTKHNKYLQDTNVQEV